MPPGYERYAWIYLKRNTDPMRMCVACRELKPKSQLMRIALTKDGPVLDRSGKMDGRGLYVCPDNACIARLSKGKKVRRGIPVHLPESLLEDLRNPEVPK